MLPTMFSHPVLFARAMAMSDSARESALREWPATKQFHTLARSALQAYRGAFRAGVIEPTAEQADAGNELDLIVNELDVTETAFDQAIQDAVTDAIRRGRITQEEATGAGLRGLGMGPLVAVVAGGIAVSAWAVWLMNAERRAKAKALMLITGEYVAASARAWEQQAAANPGAMPSVPPFLVGPSEAPSVASSVASIGGVIGMAVVAWLFFSARKGRAS